jgi:hypothetical protein
MRPGTTARAVRLSGVLLCTPVVAEEIQVETGEVEITGNDLNYVTFRATISGATRDGRASLIPHHYRPRAWKRRGTEAEYWIEPIETARWLDGLGARLAEAVQRDIESACSRAIQDWKP